MRAYAIYTGNHIPVWPVKDRTGTQALMIFKTKKEALLAKKDWDRSVKIIEVEIKLT
jgi:hypothetical protein